MADELSRVGDRLTRARERTWLGATNLLLPVRGSREARREPTRVRAPHAPDERERHARSDAGADKKRPPTTLVAIHVEVRHPSDTDPSENTARFVEARVDDVAQAHQHEIAIEDEPAAFVEHVARAFEPDDPVAPVVALPAVARSGGPYSRQSRIGSALHFVAARAVSAYLTQQSLMTASDADSRLVDVRV